jgi:hypothetical protein
MNKYSRNHDLKMARDKYEKIEKTIKELKTITKGIAKL